jgi:hypothetical protein
MKFLAGYLVLVQVVRFIGLNWTVQEIAGSSTATVLQDVKHKAPATRTCPLVLLKSALRKRTIQWPKVCTSLSGYQLPLWSHARIVGSNATGERKTTAKTAISSLKREWNQYLPVIDRIVKRLLSSTADHGIEIGGALWVTERTDLSTSIRDVSNTSVSESFEG